MQSIKSSDRSQPSNSERREVLRNGFAGIRGIAFTVAGVVKPALADVSDGNALPDGAAQFSRVLRRKGKFACQ